jgi:hypothetical protein
MSEQPTLPDTARGAIIIPTPNGPVLYSLQMTNPEVLNPDHLFEGEPQFVMAQSGSCLGPDLIAPTIKYQSSIWRYSSTKFCVIMYTEYMFLNECVIPTIRDSNLQFALAHGNSERANDILKCRDRKFVPAGGKLDGIDHIPNVECFLKASDFGWDGFITMIQFSSEGNPIFGGEDQYINVNIYSAGAKKTEKIRKLFKLPVHNMYPEGRWCVKTESLKAIMQHPSSVNPSALYHDLTASGSNFDLDGIEHKNILAEPVVDQNNPDRVPQFRLYPDSGFSEIAVNISLPPVWEYIKPF